MIEKKEIELEKSREVLSRLNEVPEPVLSARQFIAENFEALQKSGKSLKALHHFLLSNGVDVGGYKYFREIYNRVKRKLEVTDNDRNINSNERI
jgi:hypothetical protein